MVASRDRNGLSDAKAPRALRSISSRTRSSRACPLKSGGRAALDAPNGDRRPARGIPMHIREPIIKPVEVESLRPTQMTVGMREVEEKRQRWKAHKASKRAAFLGSHLIPV